MGMFLSCITGLLKEQENLIFPLLCKEGIGEVETSIGNKPTMGSVPRQVLWLREVISKTKIDSS
jgi:hypothetical protein